MTRYLSLGFRTINDSKTTNCKKSIIKIFKSPNDKLIHMNNNCLK